MFRLHASIPTGCYAVLKLGNAGCQFRYSVLRSELERGVQSWTTKMTSHITRKQITISQISLLLQMTLILIALSLIERPQEYTSKLRHRLLKQRENVWMNWRQYPPLSLPERCGSSFPETWG